MHNKILDVYWNSLRSATCPYCLRRFLTFSTALALSENNTITHLNLTNCGIGADGVDQLSAYLRKKASLQLLDLSENNIGSKGLTNLGKLNMLLYMP